MSAAVASSANIVMPGLQPLSHNNTSDHNVNRLTLNLSSNNPFRGRADSPALASPRIATSPNSIAPPQADVQNRMSKNPFLDDAEIGTAVSNPNTINVPADIFNDLSLLDQPANEPKSMQKGPAPPPPFPSQAGRVAPSTSNGANGPSRGPPRPPGSPRKADFDRQRRPRGMSETSVTEKERRDRRERDRENRDRPPRTESEERRRQERRKTREERHKQREKDAAGKDGRKPRRLQGLDIIDKLDVTGVYGQGLFHHDGPFDACNPHRNAKRDRRAPMQAFPANSANMQLSGSGPINTRLDLDRFHGRGEEAFGEFNTTARRGKTDTIIVDPTSRVEAIHGDETYGLGTSTFLEGAPASRKDLQRQDTDDRDVSLNGGGLSRKKSLAQKFRGMSSGRASRPDIRSPDARYNGEVFDPSPVAQHGNKSVSAGGMSRANYSRDNEINPFDNDYENATGKKGVSVRTVEQDKAAVRAHTPTSPNAGSRGLTRAITTDSSEIARPGSGSGDGEASKSGFLSRMKSLKSGKRARPERRAS